MPRVVGEEHAAAAAAGGSLFKGQLSMTKILLHPLFILKLLRFYEKYNKN